MKDRRINRILAMLISVSILFGVMTGQLLTLCKALFAYSDSARAYFG